MCGIAGYVGLAPLAPERLAACQALMRRRGPDAEGVFSAALPGGRHVHLLHSRLAIIDLDPRSNQPFEADGGVMTYNGEIYNYLELRAQLERDGWRARSVGDTEILARLLSLDGDRAFARCEGMYAVARLDRATGRLLLGRDRFGEKPLWMARDGDGFFFGSEPKFLFALMGKRPRVDRAHLRRYLVNGYKALYKTGASFFEGVSELPAGYAAVLEPDGNLRSFPHWTPRFPERDESMDYDSAVAGTRARLTRAVELRLRADVPIAFCLSGGIDSNALISIAKRELGHDVHGFTIMNTDQRYEEREMVDIAVRELALKHTPIPIEVGGFLPGLRELIRQHDAPVYTLTYFAHWRLMEAVRAAGYKVSVSGTAADELFSGYYDHHNAYLAAMADESPERYAAALGDWRRHVEPIVRNPFLRDPDYLRRRPFARDHIYLDADEFAAMLVDPFAEPFVETCYTEPLLRNRMANELFHESVPVILHEDDSNAMYHSIENRSPFLDTELFDWCQRIPTRHLVRDGRAKAVLRDAVRGLAPDAILDNPRKVGFNAPLFDYLDVADPTVREELLADGPVWDVIKREPIEVLLKQGDLPNSRSKFLFNFVNAKFFLEEYAA